jgi:WD40 repeat protein
MEKIRKFFNFIVENANAARNENNVPSLKIMSKIKIMSLIIERQISWNRIENVLPLELLEYINMNFNKITTNIHTPYDIIELEGHSSNILWVHEDDEDTGLYITGSTDKTARIWNVKLEKCIKILQHDDEVRLVYLSSILTLAITITNNGTLYLWNIGDFKLVKKTIINDYIYEIKNIGNRFIVFIAMNDYHVMDVCNMDNVTIIDKFSINFLPHKTIKCQVDNCYNIVLFNIENGSTIKLKGHRDKINDIIYLPRNNIVISCSDDNTIRFWDMESGSCSIIIDINKPLMIRIYSIKFLIIVSKISNNIFTYYIFDVSKKIVYHLATMFLPNITNNYEISGMEIGRSEYGITTVIVTLTCFYSNHRIWGILTFVTDVNDKIRNLSIHMSISEPIKLTNDIIVIQPRNNYLLILNLISNYTINFVPNDIDNVTFYHKNSKSQYFILGLTSGKCQLRRVSIDLTLEQYLMLSELQYHKKESTVMAYNEYYNKVLTSNKHMYIYTIQHYAKELYEILKRNGLKNRAKILYNKTINNLDIFELCELCKHNYLTICK